MSLHSVSGIVLNQDIAAPIEATTLRLESPAGTYFTESNAYGQFVFQNIPEPDVPAGTAYELQVYAYCKNGWKQHRTPQIVKAVKGEPVTPFQVDVEYRGPVSKRAGLFFLFGLIGLFSVLGYFYFQQHNSGDQVDGNSPSVVNYLATSLTSRITKDSAWAAGYSFQSDSLDTVYYAQTRADLEQIRAGITELFRAGKIDTSYLGPLTQNLLDANQAITEQNNLKIVQALTAIKQGVRDVPVTGPSWLWERAPWRYYEIVLWALFATMLRLIGNTSYYVSRNSFYRDSIPHKVALLFTIPIIALLIAFIFSFLKIVFVIGGEDYPIDFTSPYMSIVLASLIGLAPWKAWDLMYHLADSLFISLNKRLGPGSEKEIRKKNLPPASPGAPAEPITERKQPPEIPTTASGDTPPPATDS